MYKTLGGYTWSGSLKDINLDECPMNTENSPDLPDDVGTITKAAADFHLTLENLKMVSVSNFEEQHLSSPTL